MIDVSVVGCGYWGPNLIRNFVTCSKTNVKWVCDTDGGRIEKVLSPYPGIKGTTDLEDVLSDGEVKAIVVGEGIRALIVDRTLICT